MSRYTTEKMNAAFARMPEYLRSVMFSEDRIATTKKIQEKYSLHFDQLGQLIEEIGYVLVGLEPSVNFVRNIAESLKLDQETAEQIGLEINVEIFTKIRESLKEMQERENTLAPEKILAEIQNPPPAPPTPRLFERKLSEPVGLKPSETITPAVASTPAPPPIQKIDPYLEPPE